MSLGHPNSVPCDSPTLLPQTKVLQLRPNNLSE